jgi:uncharacterized membrane protein
MVMEPKKTKYDTNPLDPEFERKTEEVWGEGGGGAQTQQVKGATSDIGNAAQESARGNVYSEAPTRRYDSPPLESPYQSVFVPPTYAPPVQYQPGPQVYQSPAQSPVSQRPTQRPVAGFGIPEKWAVVLPYTPLYIGLVFSLVELFLVPRKEVKVRFHASQALALHIAILMAQSIFGVISTLTDSSFGGVLFKTFALVFLIISMVRVSRGEPHRIAPLADPAQWFNEHIEPRNKG